MTPAGWRQPTHRLGALELLALGGLLLGWAARLDRIGAQSLWYDEGTSATVAPRAIPTILASAAGDIHPPLYYLLLHFWIPWAGSSETALRFPSAIVGLLTVALVYRLVADVVGRGVALAATALLATAPLPIWYSQEARMYALATGAGVLATLVLVRAVGSRGWRLWAVYAVAIAVTLYSHYFAAAIPLAHAAAMLAWAAARPRARWRPALRWAAASAAAAAAFLPWLAGTFGQLTGWPATSAPFGPDDLARRTLGLLAAGIGGEQRPLATTLPIAVGIMLGIAALAWLSWRNERDERGTLPSRPTAWIWTARGVIQPRRVAPTAWYRSSLAGLLLVAHLLVPLAALMLVSLRRPFFHAKFVLLVAPAADWLLAIGVGALAVGLTRWLAALGWRLSASGQRRGAAAVALVLIGGLVVWRGEGVLVQARDPRLARDDYRGLAQTIAREGRPGDAIVLNAPGQVELFDFYYRGDLPRYPLPASRPLDPAATAASLDAIAARHPRVWLILWAVPESDPDSVVERWLDERMFKTSNAWFGGVRAALYVNPRLAVVPVERYAPRVTFGDVAELSEVEVVALQARPGEAVPVALRWQVRRPADARYSVFVHLIDGRDYLWGQRDSEPVGGGRPTTGWRTGETIEDRHGVPILPGTPPGQYTLEIGLYQAETGQRLPVRDASGTPRGDRVLVGPLAVLPGRVGPPPRLPNPLDIAFGAMHLIGYDLHPLGRDDAPPELGRGEIALLTLYWMANDRIETPATTLEVRVTRADGQVTRRDLPMTLDRYPPERWSPGELVRDPYKIETADLAAGSYTIAVVPRDAAGRPLAGPAGAEVGRMVVR